MAFLPQGQQNQQDPNQQQNQIPTVPLIPSLQGTSGPSASQSGGTTNTAGSPGAAPSTPWQNVSAYLNANAGGGGRVADVLAGNLTSQYNTANQGIQNAQANFGQQIDQARVPYNESLASQAMQNPGQFVKDPNNVSGFQKMFNASYQGPQNFSQSQDYSNLQSQVQNAQKQASLVNQGTQGLQTLIQKAESAQGRNPTQGMTALDSLLLQENPQNFQKLSDAQKPFANLTGYLSSAQTGLDTAAQNAAKEAAATQNTLQNQFLGPEGVAPKFQQGLNQSLQDASKQTTDYNNLIASLQSKLSSGETLTPYEASIVDPSGTYQAMNPYGMGQNTVFQKAMQFPGIGPGFLSQYYTSPGQAQQPGLENVMTQQQFADAQALNQLLGQNTIGVPQQLGKQYQAPTGYGDFQGQNAIQGMYDQLKADEPYLTSMNPDQQNQWLQEIKQLSYWLGLVDPNVPVENPITPTPPQEPPPVAPPGWHPGGPGIAPPH